VRVPGRRGSGTLPRKASATPVSRGSRRLSVPAGGGAVSLTTRSTPTRGCRSCKIDTAGLDYDPLDDEGLQQIDVGDRVSVSGEIDEALFDNTELSADSIFVLENLND